MAGHLKRKNELSQEDRTKKGGSFRNSQGNQTGNLLTKTSLHMENSPCLSRDFAKTIQRKQTFMEQTSLGCHPISLREKKSMKLNGF